MQDLIIRWPRRIEQGRGINATNGVGSNLRIRMTDDEYYAMRQAAGSCRLSLSMFARSIINDASKIINDMLIDKYKRLADEHIDYAVPAEQEELEPT